MASGSESAQLLEGAANCQLLARAMGAISCDRITGWSFIQTYRHIHIFDGQQGAWLEIRSVIRTL